MPGTEVAIGWNSPASGVPGFMSNVSFWLGPPAIHSKMHDLCLAPDPAACAAITSSQPDTDARAAPAADNLSKPRRDRSWVRVFVMRGLRSGIRSQGTGVRGQVSGVFTDSCPLTPDS